MSFTAIDLSRVHILDDNFSIYTRIIKTMGHFHISPVFLTNYHFRQVLRQNVIGPHANSKRHNFLKNGAILKIKTVFYHILCVDLVYGA